MKAKVIDNFLPQDYFDQIVDVFENQSIAWFWSDCVAYDADDSEFYFTHTFYKDHTPNSDYFSMFDPLLKKLNCRGIIRFKANLYTRGAELVEHAKHSDFDFPHKAAILYINSNNGYTRLEDGSCVASVANRMLISDGSKLHSSTNCTDQKRRITLSLNYF